MKRSWDWLYLLPIIGLLVLLGGGIWMWKFSLNSNINIADEGMLNFDVADVSSNKDGKLRQAAVAGQFYPADAELLGEELDGYLNQAEKISGKGKLRILLVPHAGTVFSGRTAGKGFGQINSGDYSQVILLGGSHRFPLVKAAVDDSDTWETPLGKVKVDLDAVNFLVSGDAGFEKNSMVHESEHSLEMEVIFLQRVLKDFKIVPILFGQVNDELLDEVSSKLASLIDESTLLVVSSDLSHYPTYEAANELDKEIIKGILSGDADKFFQNIHQLETDNIGRVDTCACGAEAIKVGLRVGELLEIDDWQKIYYENSGDVSGDKSRVVGYGSVGGWGGTVVPSTATEYGAGSSQKSVSSKQEEESSSPRHPREGGDPVLEKSSNDQAVSGELDESTKREALEIARKTLEEFITSKKKPEFSPTSEYLYQPLGAFVTLRETGQLRGCMGRFEPDIPLWQVIRDQTIISATQDPRFSPVTKDELDKIKIEVSVMTPKRKIDDWQQIEMGKHGVVLMKGNRGGTFLPQVATETGWSREEFLSQLCSQKAGLPKDCYRDPETDIYVFEAKVFEEE